MPVVDRHQVSPACGGCGSTRLLMTTSDSCRYGICEDCQRVQEVETRADPHRHLCDNCAFRPGTTFAANLCPTRTQSDSAMRKGHRNEYVTRRI